MENSKKKEELLSRLLPLLPLLPLSLLPLPLPLSPPPRPASPASIVIVKASPPLTTIAVAPLLPESSASRAASLRAAEHLSRPRSEKNGRGGGGGRGGRGGRVCCCGGVCVCATAFAAASLLFPPVLIPIAALVGLESVAEGCLMREGGLIIAVLAYGGVQIVLELVALRRSVRFSPPPNSIEAFSRFSAERGIGSFTLISPPPLLFPFSLSPSFVWKGEKKRSEKKQSVHAHKRTLTRTASQPWSGRRSGKQREGRDLFFLRRPLFFFF